MEVYVLIDGQEDEILGVFSDVFWLYEVYYHSLSENGEEDMQDFRNDVDEYGLFPAIEQRGQYIKTLSLNPDTI